MPKLLALDVGTKRIGVAKADTSVKIAVPVGTITVDGTEFAQIARLCRVQSVNFLVLGLPRNNSGAKTAQSAYVERFAKQLKNHLPTSVKIYFQDESLTSVEAESRLKSKKSYQKGQLYQKGEVDAEAACIILQDFLDRLSRLGKNSAETITSVRPDPHTPKSTPAPPSPQRQTTNSKGDSMKKKTKKKLLAIIIPILSVALLAITAFLWYNISLTAKTTADCRPNVQTIAEIPDCRVTNFTVAPGDSLDAIAAELEKAGLIKNALAFKINAVLSGDDKRYQAGTYLIASGMSASEISTIIVRGESDSNVFKYTIVPGQNIFEVKKGLIKSGFSESEVESAFSKQYSNPVLKFKPQDASLEGYLYPDTYEFYNDATVEDIIEKVLEKMNQTVVQNNLEQDFASQGLNLHQGLTLASIVEEESTPDGYAAVARVFLNRLDLGMSLGSDVTAKYAADLLDPNRTIYIDNLAILDIDSPYNTRKFAGLPPAPISNPGLEAMLGVAHPAENDYLFFLTGDDGLMYYSSTESGHLQNAADHCQELCNVQL